MSRVMLSVGVVAALLAARASAAVAGGEGSGEPSVVALDLETAVHRAVERNERGRAAAARSTAAEAHADRARAAFYPSVTATAGYTRRRAAAGADDLGAAGADRVDASLVVGVSLFDARNFSLHRQARLDRDAAHSEATDELRQVAFTAAAAFVAALGAEQVVAAAQRRVELTALSSKDVRARVEAELESSNDLTLAELEHATAERDLTAARAELETAYLELGFLVDDEVRGPLVAPTELLAADPAVSSPIALSGNADGAALIGAARTRRLDVVAGYQRVAALRAFADEADARFWPRLDLLGEVTAIRPADTRGHDLDWLVAVTATWDLWDGGERAAEGRERVALAQAIALETDAIARGVARDVRRAQVAVTRSVDAVAQAERVVALARRNADETAALYRQDLVRQLEVADATARLFDAEVALARERYALASARLDLHAAQGFDPLGREVAR